MSGRGQVDLHQTLTAHARRRGLRLQVTDHPSQEWTMQQVPEAFLWDHGCRYLPGFALAMVASKCPRSLPEDTYSE
ncbi:MAG TPA: hypothetical protein VN901_12025 [Candidatus Acidoferrales bacterium]|nr:hypothetical protein [Candidatus Acidoferrales bacterium]